MYGEFDIRTGNSDKKLFFGLSEGNSLMIKPSHIHTHKYAEIHICVKGTVEFDICGERNILEAGSVLAIPKNVLHSCTRADEGHILLSFQLDGEIKSPCLTSVPEEIAKSAAESATAGIESGNCSMFAAYASLICTPFFEEVLKPQKSDDYSLIVEEFFSLHYADNSTLGDLAEMLCLSVKQAERIVTMCTGKTFKENMTEHRKRIALALAEDGRMTKKEIAEKLGYNSYSGFWKAVSKTTK